VAIENSRLAILKQGKLQCLSTIPKVLTVELKVCDLEDKQKDVAGTSEGAMTTTPTAFPANTMTCPSSPVTNSKTDGMLEG
jgi:hypothetical protein